ncbi:MAG TPA: DUF58 domain-containing protein, partial [Spirochaetia bacterium]|nr:DUF58 domain-containing protein [Spirochaetia bacterium]
MRGSRRLVGPVLGGVFLLAVYLFTPIQPIRASALFLLLVTLVSFAASRLLPRAIAVRRFDTDIRIHRGERLTVRLEIRNLWPIPIRSVTITDQHGGVVADAPPVFQVSLGPREKRILSWSADARERGEISLGWIGLSGPGPFGLNRWARTLEVPFRIIVYPAVSPITLEHRRGLPAGNIAILNRLYEDVTRYRSIREYIPGDELRRINWKVSARLGKLHTMEYLPSLYFPVLVLLNLTPADYPLDGRFFLVERAIEVAASLVLAFAGAQQEVGLLSTGGIAAQAGPLSVPIRPGLAHAMTILESLARVQPPSDEIRIESLATAPSQIAARAGLRVVAVTPLLPSERTGELSRIGRRGSGLEIFYILSAAQRLSDSEA